MKHLRLLLFFLILMKIVEWQFFNNLLFNVHQSVRVGRQLIHEKRLPNSQ